MPENLPPTASGIPACAAHSGIGCIHGNQIKFIIFQGNDPAFFVMFFYSKSVCYRHRFFFRKYCCSGIASSVGIIPVLVIARKSQIHPVPPGTWSPADRKYLHPARGNFLQSPCRCRHEFHLHSMRLTSYKTDLLLFFFFIDIFYYNTFSYRDKHFFPGNCIHCCFLIQYCC